MKNKGHRLTLMSFLLIMCIAVIPLSVLPWPQQDNTPACENDGPPGCEEGLCCLEPSGTGGGSGGGGGGPTRGGDGGNGISISPRTVSPNPGLIQPDNIGSLWISNGELVNPCIPVEYMIRSKHRQDRSHK